MKDMTEIGGVLLPTTYEKAMELATAIYGKKEEVVEVISRPTCMFAGIKGIAELQELGLVRYGDPSPYKSGRSLPIVLTDAGKAAVAV